MPENKTALVTGGAQRIGLAISLKLAELGYDIALHYNRSKDSALKAQKAIEQHGTRCALFQCDLNNAAQTEKLVPAVVKKSPNLQLLVNNASLFEPSEFLTSSSQSLHTHFQINFEAPYILSQNFAKTCQKGHIINILDTNITKLKTKHFTYLLSKKMLAELTKMTAVALAPAIRVNGIAPGLILPPQGSPKGYLSQRAKSVPLNKKGSTDHITQSIEFLVNNDFLTGQILYNDGGEHLGD